MSVITGIVTIPANERSGNVLAGSIFEFMPGDGLVNFLMTGDATGLKADCLIGGEAVALAARIPPTNRFPVKPDDSLVVAGAFAGQRLFLDLNNTTIGALTLQFMVEVAT